MGEDAKTMLVISDQDMLSAGNQVLARTIQGYLAAGFKVFFVTNRKDDDNLARKDEVLGALGQNLNIIRFPITFHELRHKLIGPGWLTRLGVSKPANELATQFPPAPEEIVPFLARPDRATLLMSRLIYRFFQYHAFQESMQIAASHKIDIVCGFEVMAAEVAHRVSRRLDVPQCTRYQGSFLKYALDSGIAQKWYPLHLRGTKVKADLYVMSNDGTKGDEVLLQLGHPKERILFLIDGVRKDIYRPDIDKSAVWSEYGIHLKEKTRIILTLSRLGIWKRHDRIIGAMPEILSEAPDTYLVIAHRGEMRPLLERYAQELGVADRVIFTGPVPHLQIYRLLNACDVYVNCNDHSNLSHTVLEALVCGKPVVSINDGSLDGIVTHRENGLLVDLPCIQSDLPAQITRLLSDDALRAGISCKARAFAERDLLSWDERMEIEVDRIRGLLVRSGNISSSATS